MKMSTGERKLTSESGRHSAGEWTLEQMVCVLETLTALNVYSGAQRETKWKKN